MGKQSKLLKDEIKPSKTRKTKIKSYFIDRKKSWAVVSKGKVISKHISLWNAQNYIPKLYRAGKLTPTDDYEIKPLKGRDKN